MSQEVESATLDHGGFMIRRTAVMTGNYLIEVFTVENLAERVGPIACTATMMARLMPTPSRQYSIAVAPDWSDQNLVSSRRTRTSCSKAAGSPAPNVTGNLRSTGCSEVDQQAEWRVKNAAITA